MNAITQTAARAIQAPALEAADPTKNLRIGVLTA